VESCWCFVLDFGEFQMLRLVQVICVPECFWFSVNGSGEQICFFLMETLGAKWFTTICLLDL
jgi:hypothetical protein